MLEFSKKNTKYRYLVKLLEIILIIQLKYRNSFFETSIMLEQTLPHCLIFLLKIKLI